MALFKIYLFLYLFGFLIPQKTTHPVLNNIKNSKPIDDKNKPDLFFLKNASKLVGSNMVKGSIVVFESTVYPGVTEEVCLPILEEESKLKCLNKTSLSKCCSSFQIHADPN